MQHWIHLILIADNVASEKVSQFNYSALYFQQKL